MLPDTNHLETASLNRIPKSYAILTAAVLIFLTLVVWSSLTTRPESDEGAFASPAYNLAYNGHFGTTVFDMDKSTLTRIDQRTYWVMPAFLLNASASFKLFGFSLFSMRLVSIFWGLVLILSWYSIVLKISGDRMQAAFCALMTATGYVVLVTASVGRGDTMCAASGFAAFAVYLWMRERNLLLAVFLSQCLVVLSGMTHFLGILAFFGLLFLTLYYDFRSLSWKIFAVALIPYVVAGSAFGWWITRDFEAFKDQFIDNATASGRTEGFSSPLATFVREFTFRYPRAFGLLDHSAGHSGPIYLKSLILVGYALGVLGVLFSKELRKRFFVVLILMGIYFVLMALIDGQKLAVYLIYITPFYTVLLAIWFYSMWEKRRIPRVLPILGALFFILLQTGGVALRCRQNTYGNYHLPTVEYLNQNVKENESVTGAQNMIFGLNPSIKFSADGEFGYTTGKRPNYIVYDPGVEDSWNEAKTFNPGFYEYLPRLLNDEYRLAYENAAFKVYVRR